MPLWTVILFVGFLALGLSTRLAGSNPTRTAVLLAALVLVVMRGLVW